MFDSKLENIKEIFKHYLFYKKSNRAVDFDSTDNLSRAYKIAADYVFFKKNPNPNDLIYINVIFSTLIKTCNINKNDNDDKILNKLLDAVYIKNASDIYSDKEIIFSIAFSDAFLKLCNLYFKRNSNE